MDILGNGILIAVIAHGMIGVSLIWDKILLQRPGTKALANYVFGISSIASSLGLDHF